MSVHTPPHNPHLGHSQQQHASGAPPPAGAPASFFERERARLVRDIAEGVESLLGTSNALNRKLEESLSVGKEFEPIAGLWSRFVELMHLSGVPDAESLAGGGGDEGGVGGAAAAGGANVGGGASTEQAQATTAAADPTPGPGTAQRSAGAASGAVGGGGAAQQTPKQRPVGSSGYDGAASTGGRGDVGGAQADQDDADEGGRQTPRASSRAEKRRSTTGTGAGGGGFGTAAAAATAAAEAIAGQGAATGLPPGVAPGGGIVYGRQE